MVDLVAAPEFPSAMLAEGGHAWWIDGGVLSGGAAITGDRQDVDFLGARWSARLIAIDFGEARQRLAYEAFHAGYGRGTRPIVVRHTGDAERPWPSGFSAPAGGLPHADGSLHDDGSGYLGEAIEAMLDADVAVLGNTCRIAKTAIGELQSGEKFSILHPTLGLRMYNIWSISSQTSGIATVAFEPPLREAVLAGVALDFARPGCVMKVVDGAGAAPTKGEYRWNSQSVSLVEWGY